MEQKQIKIKAKDDDLKGVYSNSMMISHTKEEFYLDFFTVFPPQGILASRVIMSPRHLKKMIGVLQENMKKYEDKFGSVEEAKESGAHIGFQP
ncbi:MAG TPA: DUF3467 domain-containing protein [Candidatus Nealsonbacteria bacterium]|uniref:DUF3467 domain-containing protein n=1 Tax=marine sediment metagenome TaxID=412755 RepID=A0A0F9X400_9ZZZZ|nr:DUF3467 domain-containing protein [Candidatus Nealsonbacteria bacterium]HEB46385.1 DUF3467 domain-containing protein [Candidatus Nealsonbacteria bacterium]